ncbi:MAG: hypothetical protein H8E53_10090 [Planctomycetes bacterium]|nr:hypothetical protein [Planctomycetota bacterium]
MKQAILIMCVTVIAADAVKAAAITSIEKRTDLFELDTRYPHAPTQSNRI